MPHDFTRRLRLLAIAALVLPTTAKADETPSPGGAPFDWTGLYMGAHLGGVASLSDISDPLGPSLFGNPNRATGGLIGAQIGYNLQSGAIVYGLEADIALPRVEGTSTCSALSGTFINANCRAGIDAIATVTGRLGLALGSDGRALVYGKAGAAWSTGRLHQATNDATTGDAGNPYVSQREDVTRWGWTVGIGAEYALTGNWSLKAEYDYADFGTEAVTLLPSAILDSAGAVAEPVAARQGKVSSDLHAFKVGLNYRLGEHAAPRDEPTAPPQGFGLELGTRYWYSWGRHKYDLGLEKDAPIPRHSLISRLTYDDLTASTGEVTARLTAPWAVFVQGFVGGGSITDGHMNDEDYSIPGDTVASIPYSNTISVKAPGDIPLYATIDIGRDWWRAPTYRLGTYVGYNYYRETMDAHGVTQLANPSGPSGPIPPTGHAVITQEATWQSLRLGVSAAFNLAPRVRLSADAAFLPYVEVDAEDRHYFGNTPDVASINPLNGHGVGTQLEAMLTYDVAERWSIGIGARYWSMWTTEASMIRSFDASGPADGPIQHLKIDTERAGVFGQVSYRFD